MTHVMEQLANWLENDRKLCSSAISRHGLSARIGPKGLQIGFPYRQFGKVKFTKWRYADKSAGEMKIEPSGQDMQLYNIELFDDLDGELDMLVITEGEPDCIACTQAGFQAVSVPTGGTKAKGPREINPAEDSAFKWLWKGQDYLPQLKRVKTFVIATDADELGEGLAIELAGRLGAYRCKRVVFPPDCKDPNAVLQNGYGIEVLRRCIQDAEDFIDDNLDTLANIPDEEDVEQYPISAIPSDMFRFTFPEFMVVAGTYASGKSSWVAWFTCEMARLYGIKTTFLRLEEKVKNYRNNYTIYADTHGIDRTEFQKNFVSLKDHAALPGESLNLDWIERKMEVSAGKWGCKIFVIDPWNELEHNFRLGQSETNYTAEALTRLKRKAGSLGMSLVIVAHFGKSANDKTIDEIRASDVSGSQNWGNKADHAILMMLHDFDRKTVWCKVDKSKYHAEMGRPDKVLIQYDSDKMVYTQPRRVFSAVG